MILPKEFFEGETFSVAKKLLGCYLVSSSSEGRTIGRIVETEAYLGKGDPASHSFKGETKRNAPMFGSAGCLYVYFIYGCHFCVNIVTGKKGVGEAVLIRALEPVEGIDLMQKRRGISDIKNLCNGPGKLTQAMGITKELNGKKLKKPAVYILSSESLKEYSAPKPEDITATERIGISNGKDYLLRFFIKKRPGT